MGKKKGRRSDPPIAISAGLALIIPQVHIEDLLGAVQMDMRAFQAAMQRFWTGIRKGDQVFTELDILGLPMGPYFFFHLHFGEDEALLAGIAFTEKVTPCILWHAIQALDIIKREMLSPTAPGGELKGINIVLGGWNETGLLAGHLGYKERHRKPVIHSRSSRVYNILLTDQSLGPGGNYLREGVMKKAVADGVTEISEHLRSTQN